MEQEPTNENVRRARIDLLLVQTGARVRERFARAHDWLSGLRRKDRRRLLRRWRLSLAMLALLIATSGMPIPAHAASMTVDSGAAGLVTDSKCSLAEAIVNANDNAATWPDCPAGSGADTITLPASATLDYATALGSLTALPNITSPITIQGNGSTIKRGISATTDFRLFSVDAAGNLTLSNITLTGGHSVGGGVFNNGTLTLNYSTVSGNNGLGGQGGGIVSSGTLTITQSTIANNYTPTGNSGGIHINAGTVTIANTTISGNSTANFAGGIGINGGTVMVYNSTIIGNTSLYGGGIGIQGGSISLYRSIVSGNSASGGYGNEIGNFATVNGNATNLFGHSGETTAQALYSFTPGATDITATNNGTQSTALASILNTTLANNGGPTQTHNLVVGSPALDRATGDACQAAPVNGLDQRSKVRAAGVGLTCDIGAVEYGAPTAVTLSSFKAVAPPLDLGAWLRKILGR